MFISTFFSLHNCKAPWATLVALPLKPSNCQVPPTEHSNCPNCWILPLPYRVKLSNLWTQNLTNLHPWKLHPKRFHPLPLYKPCNLFSLLLFLTRVETATLLDFSLPINLLCEVYCVGWHCDSPWLPAARTPFHQSCICTHLCTDVHFQEGVSEWNYTMFPHFVILLY